MDEPVGVCVRRLRCHTNTAAQHRNEQAAAKREPNREAGAGSSVAETVVPMSGTVGGCSDSCSRYTASQVVTMFLNTVPPVDCKCAAAAGPSSR